MLFTHTFPAPGITALLLPPDTSTNLADIFLRCAIRMMHQILTLWHTGGWQDQCYTPQRAHRLWSRHHLLQWQPSAIALHWHPSRWDGEVRRKITYKLDKDLVLAEYLPFVSPWYRHLCQKYNFCNIIFCTSLWKVPAASIRRGFYRWDTASTGHRGPSSPQGTYPEGS